jgi:hypothetical protein
VDGKIVAQIAGISVEAVIDGAMSGQIAAPHRASAAWPLIAPNSIGYNVDLFPGERACLGD